MGMSADATLFYGLYLHNPDDDDDGLWDEDEDSYEDNDPGDEEKPIDESLFLSYARVYTSIKHNGWEELYAYKNGIIAPEQSWDRPWSGSFPYNDPNKPKLTPEYNAYSAKKRELAKQTGCDIASSGALDYGESYPYLYITESRIYANWGVPTKIDTNLLFAQSLTCDHWDTLLRNFCETLNIPFSIPNWYLAAAYG